MVLNPARALADSNDENRYLAVISCVAVLSFRRFDWLAIAGPRTLDLHDLLSATCEPVVSSRELHLTVCADTATDLGTSLVGWFTSFLTAELRGAFCASLQ